MQALVVQRVDNAIHRTNHYPVDSVVSFANTYPLDSDLSVDSIIHPLNNWGQEVLGLSPRPGQHSGSQNRGILSLFTIFASLAYSVSISVSDQATKKS